MDDDFSDIQIRIDQLQDLQIKSMTMAEFHYPLTENRAHLPILKCTNAFIKFLNLAKYVKGSWNTSFIELMLTCWAIYLAWWPVRIGHPWVDILSLLCFALVFLLFPLFLTFLLFWTFLLFLKYSSFLIFDNIFGL